VFVGHYSVSYAGRATEPRVPLWVLFLAVQLLDVLWGVFVLLGIERVRIVPGITATNPLDLYFMPYTHGLLTSIGWSVAAGLAYRRWKGDAHAGAVVGVAVFSHWVLDLLVHRPDLPLVGDRYKVGLGLWNYPAVALALEALLLLGGIAWYLSATRNGARGGWVPMIVFGGVLVLVQVITFFGAPPETPAMAAGTALAAYFALAGVAGWLDRRRTAD
jgi:hypothetical protein